MLFFQNDHGKIHFAKLIFQHGQLLTKVKRCLLAQPRPFGTLREEFRVVFAKRREFWENEEKGLMRVDYDYSCKDSLPVPRENIFEDISARTTRG